MKVYVVYCWLNDYPESGGGFQGVEHIFASEEKAIDYCRPPCLFEDYEPNEGEYYYTYEAIEVEE